LHVIEVDSIGFGRGGEFVDECVKMREMGRDDVFEEM
jgi:hypothetical protein